MARSFSEQEKNLIDARLMERAEELLSSQGVKKTTVEELCQSAGISKGAFYLFYQSKEELFFKVFMKFHEKTDEMLQRGIEALPSVGTEEITTILCRIFQETSNSFLPRLISSGELSAMLRALPQEIYADHLTHDDDFVTAIITALCGSQDKKIKNNKFKKELVSRFSASFRGIFFLLLHKEDIGIEFFDAALDTHIRALVEQLWKEIR